MNSLNNELENINVDLCQGCSYHGIKDALKMALAESHRTVISFADTFGENDIEDLSVYGLNNYKDTIISVSSGTYYGNPTLHNIALLYGKNELIANASSFIKAGQENQNLLVIVVNLPEEEHYNNLLFSLSNKATFVAQEFANRSEKLSKLFIKGLNHPGLAFVNVIQSCKEKKHRKMPIAKIDNYEEEKSLDEAIDLVTVSDKKIALTGIIYSQKVSKK